MKLAGDIGGTKTVLALAHATSGGAHCIIREQTFESARYSSLDAILDEFLVEEIPITSACFGIAGPILGQSCKTTNLPWFVDGRLLKEKLGTPKVHLLNDLEAMALGMLELDDTDLVNLNPSARKQEGHVAVIAAGTGLGEAILFHDGQAHRPLGTEGGHTDFAPQNAQQDQLLLFMRKRYPHHVSWERILSGDGFSHLYDFLVESRFGPASPLVPGASSPGQDRNAIISRLGVSGEDPVCEEAVKLFVELYGAEAGNLALKSLALGGVYIGGGIGPKIRSILESGLFMKGFIGKGRFKDLLEKVPVKLSLNPKTPLIGAMNFYR